MHEFEATLATENSEVAGMLFYSHDALTPASGTRTGSHTVDATTLLRRHAAKSGHVLLVRPSVLALAPLYGIPFERLSATAALSTSSRKAGVLDMFSPVSLSQQLAPLHRVLWWSSPSARGAEGEEHHLSAHPAWRSSPPLPATASSADSAPFLGPDAHKQGISVSRVSCSGFVDDDDLALGFAALSGSDTDDATRGRSARQQQLWRTPSPGAAYTSPSAAWSHILSELSVPGVGGVEAHAELSSPHSAGLPKKSRGMASALLNNHVVAPKTDFRAPLLASFRTVQRMFERRLPSVCPLSRLVAEVLRVGAGHAASTDATHVAGMWSASAASVLASSTRAGDCARIKSVALTDDCIVLLTADGHVFEAAHEDEQQNYEAWHDATDGAQELVSHQVLAAEIAQRQQRAFHELLQNGTHAGQRVHVADVGALAYLRPGHTVRGPRACGAQLPRIQRVAMLTRVSSLAAGATHVLAICSGTGRVFSWGANDCGQCGCDARLSLDIISSPEVVGSIGTRVHAIAAGRYHSVLLTTGGTLYTCGLAAACGVTTPDDGGPAHAHLARVCRPALDAALADARWVVHTPYLLHQPGTTAAIAAGDCHSVALTDAGDAWCWGIPAHAQATQPTRAVATRAGHDVTEHSAPLLRSGGVDWPALPTRVRLPR
ncbi:MAG: hypothetical protein EOO41_01615, partial [Methanobacteriota archaeon]